jgi:hypothetical protein
VGRPMLLKLCNHVPDSLGPFEKFPKIQSRGAVLDIIWMIIVTSTLQLWGAL